jgi:hypothetical protein
MTNDYDNKRHTATVNNYEDRQYNGLQKVGQTIQWSTESRTDNTMV